MVVMVIVQIPKEYIETAQTLGAGRGKLIFNVILPFSLPGIFDSSRTMMAAGWTIVIIAELVAADSGIGKMIIESQRFLQTGRVIGGIIIIGIIGLLFDTAFRITRPVLFPWSETTTY